MVNADGSVLFANAALEDALGTSRRTLEGSQFGACFHDPQVLRTAIDGACSNDFATLRYEAMLRRVNHEMMPVQVTLAQSDKAGELIIEMSPLEQQARQDREERLLDQAQANKELIRNLAHEIKNPLGGIRGAAQLLQMEVESRDLIEYTQVIIHEADRLQTLVDRLLAPHRRPHVVGDVNIHEVCERVRSVILAEFPRDLQIERDFDVSIPEFRGDREQLIQATLNIVSQRRAGACRTSRSGRCIASPSGPASRGRSSSTSSGIDWHWNCMSSTTDRACRTPSRTASSTRWCRAGKAEPAWD